MLGACERNGLCLPDFTNVREASRLQHVALTTTQGVEPKHCALFDQQTTCGMYSVWELNAAFKLGDLAHLPTRLQLLISAPTTQLPANFLSELLRKIRTVPSFPSHP